MKSTFMHHPFFLVGGGLMALCVAALRLGFNERLGVSGALTQVVDAVGSRGRGFGWKAWFFVGLVGGGGLFALLTAGDARFHGYGWLTRTFTGSGRPLVGVLLLVGGVMIGYGAKVARGCTAGNGLSGCSLGSPASLAATATFMGTAIAGSFVIKALI
jgi:uncharacterized membrane protein YedE/YeeE